MSTIQIFSGSKRRRTSAPTALAALLAVSMAAVVTAPPAVAQEKMTTPTPAEKKPNILVIMGDDVGWLNIGAYHRGMMSGKTPNLDKLASQGDDVHRLLRRGELYRRKGELHYRRIADPHWLDDCRTGGSRRGFTGSSGYACHCA